MPESPAAPADSDVIAYLETCGFYDSAEIPTLAAVVAGYANAAWEQFQTETGHLPFLKDSEDVVRTFDPPGGESNFSRAQRQGLLDGGPVGGVSDPTLINRVGMVGGGGHLAFDAGLLALTSIQRNIDPADPDNPDGTWLDLTEGTDFLLWPYNAPARGKPYLAAKILRPFHGAPGTVQVTGRWGYSTVVPDDVFKAVVALACYNLGPLIGNAISDGFIEWKSETTEMKLPEDALGDSIKLWKLLAKECINRYRFVTFGSF